MYTISVSGATDNYKIRVTKDSYRGDAGDSFNSVNGADGMAFSTKDMDNDRAGRVHCAEAYHGAWWYNSCHESNLNGKWGGTAEEGVTWSSITGHHSSVTFAEMKIRPL